MCIEVQRDYSLHDAVDDDTLEYLSSLYSFKLKDMSVKQVIDHWCKNGWETGYEYWRK